MSAVQIKGSPLAGLLSSVKVFDLAELSHNLTKPDMQNLSKPDMRTSARLTAWLSKVVTENLPKLDIESAEMLTNVDILSGKITTNCDVENLSKPDIRPAARAGMVRGEEVGGAPGAALVAQQADQSSATSGFGARRCNSVRATLTSCWISSPAFAPISSMRVSASRDDSSRLSPLPSSWRRVISLRIALTMKPAVDSPGCFTHSISLKTSCGTRTFLICDLLLTLPVAIGPPVMIAGVLHYIKACAFKSIDKNAHLSLN